MKSPDKKIKDTEKLYKLLFDKLTRKIILGRLKVYTYHKRKLDIPEHVLDSLNHKENLASFYLSKIKNKGNRNLI